MGAKTGHSAGTQGHHQRGQVLEGRNLLQQQSDADQHQSIAGITHAQGEEQQEEDRDEGRRVESVVSRPAVHVGEHLEHLHELVVLEADGRVLRRGGGFFQVEDTGLVEGGRDRVVILRGGIAFQAEEGILRCRCSRRAGQTQVQTGERIGA